MDILSALAQRKTVIGRCFEYVGIKDHCYTSWFDVCIIWVLHLLSEEGFSNKRLFKDIFPHAGEYRTYNITKSEWVLNGETVLYASADSIRDTLDYDFGQEKQFSYEGLSAGDAVKHIAKFTSGICAFLLVAVICC